MGDTIGSVPVMANDSGLAGGRDRSGKAAVRWARRLFGLYMIGNVSDGLVAVYTGV